MGLLSFLGGAGGGFGMDNQSAASQSTPFYNESGINFRSPGAGTITAGDVGSSAAPVRGTGPAPTSASSSPLDLSLGGGGSAIPWIIAAIFGIFALVLVVARK